MEDLWRSVDETTGHLGIRQDTVHQQISEWQMQGHNIGRLCKLIKKEANEWVRGRGADDKKRQVDKG